MSEITEAMVEAGFAAYLGTHQGATERDATSAQLRAIYTAMSAAKPVEGYAVERAAEAITDELDMLDQEISDGMAAGFTKAEFRKYAADRIARAAIAALSPQPGEGDAVERMIDQTRARGFEAGVEWERQRAALASPQPGNDEVIERVRAEYGSANSHCFDDRIMVGEECIGFSEEPWTDRIVTALTLAKPSVKADGERVEHLPNIPGNDKVIERVGPDEFYGAVGVAMFKADLGGLPIDQKINFVGNAAYLAKPSVKADGERVLRAMKSHEVIGVAYADGAGSCYRVMRGGAAIGGDYFAADAAHIACDALNAEAVIAALSPVPSSGEGGGDAA